MAQRPPSLLALTSYLLSQTGKTGRGRVTEVLAARALRMWHMAVLAALADFGPQAQRDLAARLSIDPSDMVKVLDELAAATYVDRTRDPSDRRRITVTITATGRTALAGMATEVRAMENDLLAPLDASDRAHLHTMLTRILDHQDTSDRPKA